MKLDEIVGPGSVNSVISLGNNVQLRIDADGTLSGLFRHSPASAWKYTLTDVAIDGEGWKFVSYTYDNIAQTQKLYIDGVMVGESNHADTIHQTSGRQDVIGANGDGITQLFINSIFL